MAAGQGRFCTARTPGHDGFGPSRGVFAERARCPLPLEPQHQPDSVQVPRQHRQPYHPLEAVRSRRQHPPQVALLQVVDRRFQRWCAFNSSIPSRRFRIAGLCKHLSKLHAASDRHSCCVSSTSGHARPRPPPTTSPASAARTAARTPPRSPARQDPPRGPPCPSRTTAYAARKSKRHQKAPPLFSRGAADRVSTEPVRAAETGRGKRQTLLELPA